MRKAMVAFTGLALIVLVGLGSGCGKTGSSQQGDKQLDVSVGQKSYDVVAKKTTEVGVTVTRTNLKGDVTVEISNLPKGVTVEGDSKVTLNNDTSSHTYRLKGPDEVKTEVTDHEVSLSARHKDMKEDANVKFKVNVNK